MSMLFPSFEIFYFVVSFLLKIKISPVSQSFSKELHLSIKNDVMTSVVFCFDKKYKTSQAPSLFIGPNLVKNET